MGVTLRVGAPDASFQANSKTRLGELGGLAPLASPRLVPPLSVSFLLGDQGLPRLWSKHRMLSSTDIERHAMNQLSPPSHHLKHVQQRAGN